MIIDFTIQNFRSIKDEQVFSLNVEKPKQHLATHVAYPGSGKIGALRSAGIYGANASGKSNILLAFEALRYIVVSSGDLKEGDSIPAYEPFRLSDSTKNAPVIFEIEFFTKDNVRYVYRVSFNKDSILEESLDFFPSRQKATIFTRSETDTWETISFGGLYKGGTKRIPFFKNNSYLSKAGDNAAAADLIRSIYYYFKHHITYLGLQETVFIEDFFINDKVLGKLTSFLSNVDTGIYNIKTKINANPREISFPDGFPVELKKAIVEKSSRQFLFEHATESGEVEVFGEDDESDGTRKLFELFPLLFSAFSRGNILIIDELDSSFHPHIAELIIKLFNDVEVNSNNAQLIFSTHNLHLMSPANLRRDQIWFTEKRKGSTTLFSLDEFDKSSVKSDSPYSSWYNNGRFGAIPSINYFEISNLLRPTSINEISKDAFDNLFGNAVDKIGSPNA